ncbi:MAG: septum formation initiator family protein [Eubacteriales bacterium]|nr:septum formation initiator family protein [Eubacteriales bacterium]
MSKEKKQNFLKSTLGIGILCALAAIVMIIRGISIQPEINQNKQEIAELENEIEAAKEEQAEVDKMRENADSDEYIEKVARDKLGMVKNDEIVFIDVSEE